MEQDHIMQTDTTFPGVSFLYGFRDYQARVLAELPHLLQDDRVHISAAPGAGKTILGLEIIRQLNRRALILVPTLTIRNQWKERFLDSFISKDAPELYAFWNENFSLDLQNPGIITCSTYQALYSLYSKKEAEEEPEDRAMQNNAITLSDCIRQYKELGVETICLDEAHHLKREWWKALTLFVEKMSARLIALTATPPLDTTDLEWKRYVELCGEIDLMISIPEMVINKCLCPHQDYLYLCRPTPQEERAVKEEKQRDRSAALEILRLPLLYSEIKILPLLSDPSSALNTLFKYPDYLFHLVEYAAFIRRKWQIELEGSRDAADRAFSHWDKRILRMVLQKAEADEQAEADQIRRTAENRNLQRCSSQTENLNRQNTAEERTLAASMGWLLPLMRDILENDPDSYSEELKNTLTNILKNHHLLKNGRPAARSTEDSDRILKNSASKLNAIEEIVVTESASMGDKLRCLVLMDHIRQTDMSKVETDESLTDLGVSTVFERLRRQEHLGNLETYFAPDKNGPKTYRTRLGVLTGSLIILPTALAERLAADLRESKLGDTLSEGLRVRPLGVTGYAKLELTGSSAGPAEHLITSYFEEGLIEILIGTAALLGEGWDAPAVNTLIIGSTSSMYVKTNQMRGRALRTFSGEPEKVSNIWHLMAVSPEEGGAYKGDDHAEGASILQRFDSIVGLSMDGRRIENGISRLTDPMHDLQDPEKWNNWMKERAKDRRFVRESWESIPVLHASPEVRNVVEPPIRLHTAGQKEKGLSPRQQFAVAKGTLAAMKAAHLLENRCRLAMIKKEYPAEAHSPAGKRSNTGFYLENATERESRAYAACLQQALSPVVAPKFMLRLGFLVKKYIPVPSDFSGRAALAELYRDSISGAKNMISTSTDEGKTLLLKERLRRGTLSREEARIIQELT